MQIRVVARGWRGALGERGRRGEKRIAMRRGAEQARRGSGGIVRGSQLQCRGRWEMCEQLRLRGSMKVVVVVRTVVRMSNRRRRRGPTPMVRTLWLLRGLHGDHNAIEREGEVVEVCFDMLRKLRMGSRSGPFGTPESG